MNVLLKCGAVKKHIVLKIEELQQMHGCELQDLEHIINSIQTIRKVAGKDPSPEYIVVNTDEPYIGEIIDVLKHHHAWGDEKDER